jgi:hypothetical protein
MDSLKELANYDFDVNVNLVPDSEDEEEDHETAAPESTLEQALLALDQVPPSPRSPDHDNKTDHSPNTANKPEPSEPSRPEPAEKVPPPDEDAAPALSDSPRPRSGGTHSEDRVEKDTQDLDMPDVPFEVAPNEGNEPKPDDQDGDETETGSHLDVGSLFGEDDLTKIQDHSGAEASVQADLRESAYTLRPTARASGENYAFVTFFDNDESGTYDPNAREPTTAKSTLPKQRLEGESLHDYALRNRVLRLSHAAARENGISLVFTLKLLSEKVKDLAERIPNKWANEHWNTLADPPAFTPEPNRDIGSSRSYKFRKRNESDPDLKKTSRIPDPAGLEDDLYGHPAARGCVACRKLLLHNTDVTCPLLEEDATWPCNFCIEDDVDCELLTHPFFKTACENCKRKKLPCSYQAKRSDGSMPCWECQDAGSICIAGPASGAIKERISYDKDYSKKPERKYVQCTACRKDRKGCSLKSKDEPPPCKRCAKERLHCDFEPLPRKPTKRKATAPGAVATKSKASALKDKHKNNLPAEAIVIRTCLCHPVVFMSTDKCHWCDLASYGHLGIGWRDVVVVPTDDGLSYTEIERGHSNDIFPSEPSSMCLNCTMERTRIIGCADHELRPIESIALRQRQRSQSNPHINGTAGDDYYELELDPSSLDVKAMYDRLFNNALFPSDKWCALCPAPALFRCCTPQQTDMWGETVDPMSSEASGCGLLLCDDCGHVYNELGDIEAVIERIEANEDKEIWGLGVRADAEFLRREGLLIKKVLAA